MQKIKRAGNEVNVGIAGFNLFAFHYFSQKRLLFNKSNTLFVVRMSGAMVYCVNSNCQGT